VQNISNMDVIWFRKKETLVEVLILDLVIIGSSMKLCKLLIELERVLSSRNEHWKFYQGGYHVSSEFSNACSFNNFLIEYLGRCHLNLFFLLFLFFLFLFTFSILSLLLFLLFFLFLFFRGFAALW